MNLLKKFFFIIYMTTFGLISCKISARGGDPELNSSSSPHPISSCTANTFLQYNTCSATEGCTLSFSCALTTQTPVNVPMHIETLTIKQPALLQANAGDAPTNWYNTPIDCTQDGNIVKCVHFLPIASDFKIVGTLGSLDLTLNIIVQNDLKRKASCGSVRCGQFGTTIQRMFDCSQRVKNYAGRGNGDGTSTNFAPGDNPNPNWFLVSSPNGGKDQCFWLSPVINASNPAAGANQFDSNGVPMSTYANSSTTKGRLLWSGVSNDTLTFFEANGNNPRGTTDASYHYYEFIDSRTMASQGGPNGPFIYRPQAFDSSPILSPIICAGQSTPCYHTPPGYPSSYSNHTYDSYTQVTYNHSLCSTNSVKGISLFTGASYAWQMPSYPMIITLTGGNSGLCEGGKHANAYCNGGRGATFVGFRSVDSIPNFKGTIIWSSSVYSPFDIGWLIGDDDKGFEGSLDTGVMSTYPTHVRCVSAAW